MFKIFKGPTNLIDVLNNLKMKALKKKIWYRALSNEERILASMIERYVKIVRNAKLATVIARMIGKLLNAFNTFNRKMITLGHESANSWSNAAKVFGWDVSDWFSIDAIRWFGMLRLSNFMVK